MISSLRRLIGRPRDPDPVANGYAAVVAQARQPDFYRFAGVPDTLDGRYDMLALHAFLVMHRLKRQGDPARDYSRRLFELMITDMDRSLREMGAGDMGVPPRVKAMAKGFNGRIHAYDRGLEAGGDGSAALLAALDNNLYGTVLEPPPGALERMAAYVQAAVAALAEQPLERLLAGEIPFPPPPGGSDSAGAPP